MTRRRPLGACACRRGPPRPAGLALGSLKETNSPRIQSLSLEIGASPTQRGVALEDSWKGEILDGFLFLGDRVTASDADRLETLRITHVLNATEDVSNFFEGAEAVPAESAVCALLLYVLDSARCGMVSCGSTCSALTDL